MIPKQSNITIQFGCQFRIELPNSRLATIMAVFASLLPQLLTDFFQSVLLGYAEWVMA